ncbi:MAG: hypothetical protein P8Y53_10835 [Pseudolabrys sp.]|jgi:hypothetical protein
MKKDPYKIDPSRSPLLPNSGYRMSGLFMAGLAGAIFIIVAIVWAAQNYVSAPWATTSTASVQTSAPAEATTGEAR